MWFKRRTQELSHFKRQQLLQDRFTSPLSLSYFIPTSYMVDRSHREMVGGNLCRLNGGEFDRRGKKMPSSMRPFPRYMEQISIVLMQMFICSSQRRYVFSYKSQKKPSSIILNLHRTWWTEHTVRWQERILNDRMLLVLVTSRRKGFFYGTLPLLYRIDQISIKLIRIFVVHKGDWFQLQTAPNCYLLSVLRSPKHRHSHTYMKHLFI